MCLGPKPRSLVSSQAPNHAISVPFLGDLLLPQADNNNRGAFTTSFSSASSGELTPLHSAFGKCSPSSPTSVCNNQHASPMIASSRTNSSPVCSLIDEAVEEHNMEQQQHPQGQAHHTSSPKGETRRSCRRSKKKDGFLNELTDKGFKRTCVRHDYHDYAKVNPLLPSNHKANNSSSGRGRGAGDGANSTFPVILHGMLEGAQQDGISHIVSWQPHGRAFHVHKQEEFVSDVMPRFFRHTRFSSFQRQLSLYGFHRLTRKGADRGSYYHELFLRGKPDLCHGIPRTRVKGTQVRQAASPETEPDFYSMEPVGKRASNSSTNKISFKKPTLILPSPIQREKEQTKTIFSRWETNNKNNKGGSNISNSVSKRNDTNNNSISKYDTCSNRSSSNRISSTKSNRSSISRTNKYIDNINNNISPTMSTGKRDSVMSIDTISSLEKDPLMDMDIFGDDCNMNQIRNDILCSPSIALSSSALQPSPLRPGKRDSYTSPGNNNNNSLDMKQTDMREGFCKYNSFSNRGNDTYNKMDSTMAVNDFQKKKSNSNPLPLEVPIENDADLALFLSEVDLDIGDESCLLGDEDGFARFLERDLHVF